MTAWRRKVNSNLRHPYCLYLHDSRQLRSPQPVGREIESPRAHHFKNETSNIPRFEFPENRRTRRQVLGFEILRFKIPIFGEAKNGAPGVRGVLAG